MWRLQGYYSTFQVESYRLPRIDDLFASLSGEKKFLKLHFAQTDTIR